MRLLVTCEHGGNRIPAQYWPLFRCHRALLESHRGYDPGALALARDVAAAFGAELVYSTTSRLLVELNRSASHRDLFSEVSRELGPEERERVLARYYRPYREWVEAQVSAAIDADGGVLHLSCHSFTPQLHGVVRRTDVGLLYDPRRDAEAELCRDWQGAIKAAEPRLTVRRNYPYRGYTDGLTTYLRTRYRDPEYCGVEIEVNQKLAAGEPRAWRSLRKSLVASLARTLEPPAER